MNCTQYYYKLPALFLKAFTLSTLKSPAFKSYNLDSRLLNKQRFNTLSPSSILNYPYQNHTVPGTNPKSMLSKLLKSYQLLKYFSLTFSQPYLVSINIISDLFHCFFQAIFQLSLTVLYSLLVIISILFSEVVPPVFRAKISIYTTLDKIFIIKVIF